MKLEEQRVIRIDGGNIMMVWTDIETGEEKYEGSGQVPINVRSPQGTQTVPINFRFTIKAPSLEEAAVKFNDELQAAGQNAAKEAVEKISAQQQKILVAHEDQVIQLRSDRMRRNGRS